MHRFERPQFIYGNEPFLNPSDGSASGPVAIGGDLSPSRLLQAYSNGIFPWFNDDASPVLWWSPDPRTILFADSFHTSRSLAKWCRKHSWTATVDSEFERVVELCSAPRSYQDSTWITPKMKTAYIELHRLGYAHSLEVWSGMEIVGGIYGVSIGLHFYGESMFSAKTNGSKVALMALCNLLESWDFEFIDCQLHSSHLQRLGAVQMKRNAFLQTVVNNRGNPTKIGRWKVRPFQALPR